MSAHIDDAANGGSEPGAWMRAMNPDAPLPATPPLPRDGLKVPVALPAPGVKPLASAGRLFDPSSHEVRNG